MRCVTYKCILIFIIIKYVESQDNNPDQPADEEDEDDNFEVLDLEQIIQERISRFDDPRYQPQYQQLEESQYPPQPQAQPQYYDLDQGETQGYQTQPQYYDVYQPQQYGPYQTPQFQTHPLEQQPYVPVTHPQTITQEQEQTQQQVSQYYYYGSETQDPYGYQQPYGTQSLYDTGQQPITDTQTQEQYYGPPPTQPSQPQYQHYEPSHPTQQQSYQYYGPPTPIQSQPQQVPQQQYYQHYVPTLTQTSTQPSYQYYDPYEPPQTYQPQEQYYGPPQPQPQPSYQHYVPSQPQVTQQPQTQPQPQTPSQPPITQPPQPQPQTIEDDDNFYVTEHAYAQQPQPQKKQRKRKKPTKRKQIQPPSGDQSDEISLSEDDEQPIKRKKTLLKRYDIKFYKRDNLGMLVEMNEGDYNVTFNDKDKKKYLFISNLERIECDGEIIFEHSSGTPYFPLVNHSKKTNIHILTNSGGFILIKKIKGQWIRTDAPIPDYVYLYTQDSEGSEVLLTKYHYTITFTSLGSFRYELLPGIKCHKIIVNGLVAWEKTEEDEGFPLVFYITPKMSVMVNFEKYFKLFERKARKYRHFCTKSSGVKPEQPPVSSESDSDGEEDNFEVTETSEPSKTSEAVKHSKKPGKMIFMKKNEEGIIVPMDEGDYKQIFEDPYKKVYIFQKNLEMILCDYKVIFNHRLGKPYASTLTYYRINNVFTIQHENGFMLICHEEGKWKVYLRSRSGYLNLYTQDSEGRYLELGENNYYISFGPRGFLRYEFKSDVNCSKVMFKDKLVWRRNSNEPCPSKINITLRKDIIVHFGDYYIIFVKKKGYKKSYKKAIIKSHRHK